jgi:hypothetical protein
MTAQIIDLAARRAQGEHAIARMAAAPVRHVPDELLAVLACVDVEDLRGRGQVPQPRAAR